MKRILVIVCLLCVAVAWSKPELDSLAVSKLYSTSWQLSYKLKPRKGLFRGWWHRANTNVHESITIYSNEFHTSVENGPYQICPMRHRNGNELWLDCKEADQVKYRVVSFFGDILTLDMYVKKGRFATYKLIARKCYSRQKN